MIEDFVGPLVQLADTGARAVGDALAGRGQQVFTTVQKTYSKPLRDGEIPVLPGDIKNDGPKIALRRVLTSSLSDIARLEGKNAFPGLLNGQAGRGGIQFFVQGGKDGAELLHRTTFLHGLKSFLQLSALLRRQGDECLFHFGETHDLTLTEGPGFDKSSASDRLDKTGLTDKYVRHMAKTLKELTAQEVLALAIQTEEEDGRIYADLAHRIDKDFPATAQSLRAMHDEEDGHRHRLISLYRERFGEHIPLIRRQDVKGFITRRPLWMNAILTVPMIRHEVETMEQEAGNFYEAAIAQTSDAAVRQLLGDLAAEESKHYELAEEMDEQQKASGAQEKEDATERRRFVLQIVQPGLAGLMDGSVSTLAPVFAAAFATHTSHYAFLVGLAASIGAGISMGFAEALSDDGVLSGRGHPLARGIVCGLMTTAGGIGHTLPFLISVFNYAMIVAVAVVAVELAVIAWIRHRYMDTPLLSAAFQVIVGGTLVFIVGILIGSA